MANVRKNTLVVDFGVLPVRPEMAKIEQFLYENIKLQLNDVASIQLHSIRNCVLVELISAELALKYQNGNNLKHIIVLGGRGFKIPVHVDDAAVTVRIHDLSKDIPHIVVKNYMEERYGVVLSIGRERWKHYFPGIPNGVRLLRMHLSKPIPSYIEIKNQLTTVTYENEVKTCRYCQKEAHPKRKCFEHTIDKTSSRQQSQQATGAATQTSLFNEDDFPVLAGATVVKPTETMPTHLEPNAGADYERTEETNNNNNGDNTTDSSSEETETNKRRLSTRRRSDSKKMCIPQGCQNEGEIVRTGVRTRSQAVIFSSKLKDRSASK